MTLCKYEHYLFSQNQKGPDTNANIIRFPKNDRIRMWILVGFPKMTKYEYTYCSVSQKWPNRIVICLPKNYQNQIRISLSFPKLTEGDYKYYSVWKSHFPIGYFCFHIFGGDFGILNIFWLIKSINAKQNMYTIWEENPSGFQLEKIRIIFGLSKSPKYE